MQSHRAEFRHSDILKNILGSLIPVALFVLALHAGVWGSFWPVPRPTLDTERTVLLHQADACRATNQVELLLLGDSSCLMDISARRLEEKLGRRTLSLATFSFLDPAGQALLLQEYARRHPVAPRWVILLMHPQALRRLGSDAYYVTALTNYWSARDQSDLESLPGQVSFGLGIDIFNARFRSRLPIPLPGAYGRRYGFTADLERYMASQGGSAVDPDQERLSGNPEFRLAATLAKASRAFRAAMPPGTKLIAGITPIPAQLAGPRYPAQQQALLRSWGEMLQADLLLTNLAPTRPDGAFARTTHLREPEVPAYTDQLVTNLQTILQEGPR